MLQGSFTHLRSSIAAGLAALLLSASLYYRMPAQDTETTAFLGRWSSEAEALAGAVPACSGDVGFITFAPSRLHFSGSASNLGFQPGKTSYYRNGSTLTVSMLMTTPDGDIDWTIELAINPDGTLSYRRMSGHYAELAEMAYGVEFEQDFAKHWGKLKRCEQLALR
jgi:hypothetical protein